MAYKQKGFSPFTIITDKKKKKKKPVDDDTDRMSNRQFRRHEREVEKYNKARGNYAKMRDNSRLVDKLKDQEIDKEDDRVMNRTILVNMIVGQID